MHTVRFVNHWLERKCSFMRQARAMSLSRTVGGLLRGGKLSLTHLGRSLVADCYEKHRIKSVDRLVGNRHLHAERIEVYAALAREMLSDSPSPVLVVDWADGHQGRQWLLLRASVAVQGRALTLYEEAHPKHTLGSARVEGAFLRTLKLVLPSGCTPVVVTDAGFRWRWFGQVEVNGWRWIDHTRQARIYLMRGLLRELGIVMPQGARTALSRIPELVEDAEVEIPTAMRAMLFEVLAEVRGLEQRIAELERELKRHASSGSDASHLM